MSEPKTYPNYINGEWVTGENTFEVRNPADTSEVVGVFVRGSQEDIGNAAAAAQEAFAGWAALPGPSRGKYLFKIAEILESKLDQLGEDMTREEGKTLPEAKGETMRTINIFRYFGGEGVEDSRRDGAFGAGARFHVRDSQAAGRRGTGDAVELPQRDSSLEARARHTGWQYSGSQAGVRRAIERLADHGSLPRGRCT